MFLQVLLIAVCLNTVRGTHLQCLYCNDAVNPTDCDTVVKCGPHERCYVDAFVSATGSIRYNLGCRDEAQCGLSSELGKRGGVVYRSGHKANVDAVWDADVELLKHDSSVFKQRTQLRTGTRSIFSERSNGLLICSECCTGNLCSNAGCGNAGYISPRGPICFNCAEQNTPEDCSKIRLCGQDEVCMLLKTINPMSHEVRYSTKCEGEKRCKKQILKYKEIASLLIGKRRKRDSLEISGSCLVQCCTTDMCNVNCGNNSTSTRGPTTTHTQLTTIRPEPSYERTTLYQTPTNVGTQQPVKHSHFSTKGYINTSPVVTSYRTPQTIRTTIVNYTTQPPTNSVYQTPPSPPSISAAGCFYKNKLYQEGEHWNDGCTDKCTCVDGKTGYYQCTDLCLTWDLPQLCRLRPPLPGKCCPEPECPEGFKISYPTGYVPS